MSSLVAVEHKTFISPQGRELCMPVAFFDADTDTDVLPELTTSARAEGLLVRAFTLDALPDAMIFGDRAKLAKLIAARR